MLPCMPSPLRHLVLAFLPALVLAACSQPALPGLHASPSAYPQAAMGDGCLVGHWVMTQEALGWEIPGSAPAQLVGGAKATLAINADGSAQLNYAGSAPLLGTIGSKSASLAYQGSLDYQVHAAGHVLTMTQTSGNATSALSLNGVAQAPQPLFDGGVASLPFSYACSRSTLKLDANLGGLDLSESFHRA